MSLHEHLVATTTHGRVLIERPPGEGPFPVLMGFHGYAESAAKHLPQLARLDPAHEWLRVSVQGLNRFYAKATTEVVASWMTREDREQAIADNIGYGLAVYDLVRRQESVRPPLVVAGFSQGAAQAYRVALAAGAQCAGLIVLGGDVPPDVATRAGDLPPVLVGRGLQDPWYTAEMLAKDTATLRDGGASWTVCEFAGAHEWTDVFVSAAAQWLAHRRSRESRVIS